MTFFKWSRLASSNASADASINWSEGQPPSSINDSARAMMAAAAKYRDDIAGAIITGGTSTAYTVSSFQGFDSLAHLDGVAIAFTPHTGNGNPVTLNVDSTGAKPLRSAPGVELPTGALIQGTPCLAVYNNFDGAFYVRGGSPYPYLIPLGGMLPYIGSSAPNSAFALPSGQAISRTTYATLFSLVGTTFGSGDGSTTFNVPDMRGRVFAGLDNMGGSNAARLSNSFTSTSMGNTGGEATHTLNANEVPAHNHTFSGSTDQDGPDHAHQLSLAAQAAQSGAGVSALTATGGATIVTTGGATARHAHTFSGSTTTFGAGTSHNNAQPTMVVNFILRII